MPNARLAYEVNRLNSWCERLGRRVKARDQQVTDLRAQLQQAEEREAAWKRQAKEHLEALNRQMERAEQAEERGAKAWDRIKELEAERNVAIQRGADAANQAIAALLTALEWRTDYWDARERLQQTGQELAAAEAERDIADRKVDGYLASYIKAEQERDNARVLLAVAVGSDTYVTVVAESERLLAEAQRQNAALREVAQGVKLLLQNAQLQHEDSRIAEAIAIIERRFLSPDAGKERELAHSKTVEAENAALREVAAEELRRREGEAQCEEVSLPRHQTT